MPLLVAKGITKRFGGLVAVRDLDLEIEPRSIVSVIGPNGAGKTTLFNCIAGWYRIDQGEITFEGQSISKLRRDQIARLGIARTYQNIRLFAGMSVVDNVLGNRLSVDNFRARSAIRGRLWVHGRTGVHRW